MLFRSDAEAPVPGGYDSLTSLEGYGSEVRWNVNSPTLQCLTPAQGGNPATYGPMVPGHLYRIQFLIHDGDQNKAGGDSGQACALIAR